jgi:hypothetical protein
MDNEHMLDHIVDLVEKKAAELEAAKATEEQVAAAE